MTDGYIRRHVDRLGPVSQSSPELDSILKQLKELEEAATLGIVPFQGCELGQADDKVAHKSGATSSHFSPFAFNNPFEGTKLTCQRFVAGNIKHEHGDPVYDHANWLKAFRARDVAFFRDRAGHALEHLIAEMRGNDDDDPGGNLGAVGWFVEVMAYIKVNDPEFYGAIQGKYDLRNQEAQGHGQSHY